MLANIKNTFPSYFLSQEQYFQTANLVKIGQRKQQWKR